MRDVLDRLKDEAKKAKDRKDTVLFSRLHEASREIEYFRWALTALAAQDDKQLPASFRGFVREMIEGNKIGPGHWTLHPDDVVDMARRFVTRRNEKPSNAE